MNKIYNKVHKIEMILNLKNSLHTRDAVRAEFTYRQSFDSNGNEVPEVESLKFYRNGAPFKDLNFEVVEPELRSAAINEFIKREQDYLKERV